MQQLQNYVFYLFELINSVYVITLLLTVLLEYMTVSTRNSLEIKVILLHTTHQQVDVVMLIAS